MSRPEIRNTLCVYARRDSHSIVATRTLSVKTRLWLRILLEFKHIDYGVSVITHAAIFTLSNATKEPR